MHRLAALLLATALAGCATAPGSLAADPLEPWNRKVHAFNEAVDEAVLAPVARTYVEVVPQPARTGVSNFFANFGDAWSAINNLLQAKPGAALRDTMRVGINSLFGVFGLFDVATEAGLDRGNEDFGQTLGRWGLGPGPYIVWPLLGPSNFRESLALPLDRGWSAASAFGDDGTRYGLTALSVVSTRASLLGATRMLDDIALDKYQFVRDAYLQRRRNLVYDGEPPDEEEPDDDLPPPAALPAAVQK